MIAGVVVGMVGVKVIVGVVVVMEVVVVVVVVVFLIDTAKKDI